MDKYDYPAKDEVRSLFRDFLPPDFPMNGQGPVGLYLPGPRNLELDGFIGLGIQPNRLIGVEHGNVERLQDVLEHARGVRIIPGGVGDAVATLRKERAPRLSFVHLDFDGSYFTHINDLLSVFQVFPASPVGSLAVTSYVARDDETLVSSIRSVSKFASAFPGFDGTQTFHEGLSSLFGRFERLHGDRSDRGVIYRNVGRDLGFLWWISLVLGVLRFRGRLSYGSLDSRGLRRIQLVLDHIDREAESCQGRDFYLVPDKALAPALEAQPCRFWVTGFRRVAYQSRSLQPMRTWMLKIWELEEPRPMSELVRHIWTLCVQAPVLHIDAEGKTHRYL